MFRGLSVNILCIPASSNTNISHQLFEYLIIHSTRTQIQKVFLYSKIVLKVCFKDFFLYKNKSESKIYINIDRNFIFFINNYLNLYLQCIIVNPSFYFHNAYLLHFQTNFYLCSGDKPDLESFSIMEVEGDTLKYKCSICNKMFTRKTNLFNHLETFHFPYSFSYACTICAEILNTRERLRQHKKKHKIDHQN